MHSLSKRLAFIGFIIILALYPFLIYFDILLPPNIKVNTSIPRKIESLPKFTIVRPYDLIISSPDAFYISKEIGGFSYLTQGKGGIDHYTVFDGLYKFEVRERMNHITLTLPFKEWQSADELSEVNCIQMADKIVEKVIAYYPESEVEVIFTGISEITSNDENEDVIHKRVHYQLEYLGVPITGNNTDFYVDVCERGVWGFRINYPILKADGSNLMISISPIQAIKNVVSGSKKIIVNRVELCYYADLMYDENVNIGYLIEFIQDGERYSIFVNG